MARDYTPTLFSDIHDLYVYCVRYQSKIVAALTLVDPAYATAFNTLMTALQTLNAVATIVDPPSN